MYLHLTGSFIRAGLGKFRNTVVEMVSCKMRIKCQFILANGAIGALNLFIH